MKKSVLLALAALTLGGASAVAQEVTYEPDCSQGLLLNKNKDNWFLTVQGGTNIMFSQQMLTLSSRIVSVPMPVCM